MVRFFAPLYFYQRLTTMCRLLELAPNYFDLRDLKAGETKRALTRVQNKTTTRRDHGGPVGKRKGKKTRK